MAIAPKLNLTRRGIFRYFYAAATLLIILSLIPSNQKFNYDYSQGKPWAYDDLYAPFGYAIDKSESEISQEKVAIESGFEPFYAIDTGIKLKALKNYSALLADNWNAENINPNRKLFNEHLTVGNKILTKLYDKGIIRLDAKHKGYDKDKTIYLLHGLKSMPTTLKGFYRIDELVESIDDFIPKTEKFNAAILKSSILSSIQPNVSYDARRSEKALGEKLALISTTNGRVEANELIITRGRIVTNEDFKKLESLKYKFKALVQEDGYAWHLTGYIILVVIIFLIYIGYIQLFQIQLIRSNRRLLLLLLNIVLFVFVTRYVTTHEELNVFVIPFCIVPIVTLAFFDYKLAIITHIVVVLIVGSFISSNEGKFIIIQLIAGFTAILGMKKIQYLSKFFVSALVILGSYVFSFFAFNLTEISSLSEINPLDYVWLTGNFMLTLLAFPLIYAYEKIFGFVSDITLVELADVNKKLLRKLSVEAPGTFQHSLQVANLSESVINAIGGRALLTRVGALYHDIGKMANPEFFIENQRYVVNPHENLTEEESAQMIISHVTEGVKMAKQNGLPSVIIEFIKTHHGQSRVEYFYRNYLKKVPSQEVDESKFRYAGPKPSTREMTVVMICDSVEAATRSLKDQTPENLSKMIDGIINGKLNDHQMDEAPITLAEIHQMRVLLKDLINSMYHVRIEYPKEEEQ